MRHWKDDKNDKEIQESGQDMDKLNTLVFPIESVYQGYHLRDN